LRLVLLAGLVTSSPPAAVASEAIPRLRLEVVAAYPHDPEAYTQGLLWFDGSLYESTGLYGASSVRKIDLESGTLAIFRPLPPDYFGEGLARVGERLVQLTWQQGLALLFSLDDLEELGERSYVGEGWGLCFDGRHLIMSDGTQVLSFHDPETFAVVRRLEVTRGGTPLDRLNELEWVDGSVYANVYQTEEIVRIDPHSGAVVEVIDASGLLSPRERRGAEVLNGIAYRPDSGTFLLTGKRWPRVFEVRFVPTS
jgi:glutamine cyclotransferase